MQNLLAKVCQICPFCIARRKWPESMFGRFMAVIERGCPFCRAYDRLHENESSKTENGAGEKNV